MKIRNKILLLFLIAFITPLIVLSTLYNYYLIPRLEDDLKRSWHVLAHAAINEVNVYLNDMQNLLNAVSSLSSIRDFSNPDIQKRTLKEINESFGNITYFYIVNAKGMVTLTEPHTDFNGDNDFSKRAWFRYVKDTGHTYISENVIISDATNRPTIFIAAPIKDQDSQFLGVVGADLDLKYLSSSLQKLGFEKTGKVLIADINGIIFAHSGKERVFQHDQLPESIRTDLEVNTLQQVGGELLLFEQNPPLDWKFAVTQDYKEAYQEIGHTRLFLFIVPLFALMAGTPLMLYWTQIIAKPIDALVGGVAALTDGKFGYQVKRVEKDEFSYLTESFNMISKNTEEVLKELKDKLVAMEQIYSYNWELVRPFLEGGTMKKNNRQTTINIALDKLMQIMQFARGTLFLLENQQVLVFNRGLDSDLLARLKLYLEKENRELEVYDEQVMVAPLMVENGLIGYLVIEVDHDKFFTEEHFQLFKTVTGFFSFMLRHYDLVLEKTRLRTLYEDLLETVDYGILTVNKEGLIMGFNSTFANLFQLAPEHYYTSYDVTLNNWKNITGNQDYILLADNTLNSGAEYRGVEQVITLGKKSRLLLEDSYLIKDSENKVEGVLVIINDQTELQEIRNNLGQMEKFSAVGQLAAGLAHEIRNPMTSLKGFAQLLFLNSTDPNQRELYEIMVNDLDRINKLINEFLLVAKPSAPALELCDFKIILQDIVLLLRSEAVLKDQEISLALPKYPAYIKVDSNQVKQVVLNVIRNAFEASPPDTCIRVILRSKGDYWEVDINDQGTGIPRELAGKIFDPFFTTKSTGTGLGLSVSYQIIKAHKGNIRFKSKEEGEGTTFIISLPKAGGVEQYGSGVEVH